MRTIADVQGAKGNQVDLPVFSIVYHDDAKLETTPAYSAIQHLDADTHMEFGSSHPPLQTFSTQVVVFALLASWLAQQRQQELQTTLPREKQASMSLLLPHQASSVSSFHAPANGQHPVHKHLDDLHRACRDLPHCAAQTLQTHAQMSRLAARLHRQKAQHMFVLGKGFGESVAMEGAMQLKQHARVHAEGFSGGALKHGPFALLSQGTPVVCVVLNDEHAQLMRLAAEEIRSRGAHLIVITNHAPLAEGLVAHADDAVVVPPNGPLSALLAVMPLHMLAHEMASKNKGNK